MYKYLQKLCNAIIAGKFDERKYRQRKRWYGLEIQTTPLFCSYGTIGFKVYVYQKGRHSCTLTWDWEMEDLNIDGVRWKEYINALYLEDNDIYCDCAFWLDETTEAELETYTEAGGDMLIHLDDVSRKSLKDYIDNFDINEKVSLWWANGVKGKGVPFDNMREHYEDYEKYLHKLQKVCEKMPY